MDLQESIRNFAEQVQEAEAPKPPPHTEPKPAYQLAHIAISSEVVARLLDDPIGTLPNDLGLKEETTRVTVIRKPRTGDANANLVLVVWADGTADLFIST